MWVDEDTNCSEAESILKNYGEYSFKNWGQGIENAMVSIKNYIAEFFISQQDLTNEGEKWASFMMQESNFIRYLGEIENYSKKVAEQVKKLISADLSKMSNRELLEMHINYVVTYGKLMNCYIVTQPHRIAKLEREVINFLKQKGVQDVNGKFVTLISSGRKFTFSEKAKKFLEKSLTELKKEKNFDFDLAEKLYTEEVVESEDKEKLIKELEPTKEILHAINVLGILGNERIKMRCNWMPAVYFYDMFLIEIARRHNVSRKDIKAYEENEIENLIATGEKIDSSTIKEREKGLLKIIRNGKIESYQGEQAHAEINRRAKEKETKKEMKGMVAHKGKVTGKAVIFSYKHPEEHAKKIKSMETGSIIISEMTRPNLVPALSKAVAIVTDEGGITCHAAIVAREFNLPTIVGTKIATNSIKDGDIVEVDAEQGIVRVLEK